MKKTHKIKKNYIDIHQLLCYYLYWRRVYVCIYNIYIYYIYMVSGFLQLKVENYIKIYILIFWSGNSGNSGNRSREVLKQQQSAVTTLPYFCYHCYHFPFSLGKLTSRFFRLLRNSTLCGDKKLKFNLLQGLLQGFTLCGGKKLKFNLSQEHVLNHQKCNCIFQQTLHFPVE